MTELISGLKLGQKLGNGAFGEVFLGDDDAHGEVAVKVLSRDTHDSDESWQEHREAFLAEAQNLSKATHNHVVQVHHMVAAKDGNSVQICMELCRGGSLQTHFETGPMTIADVRAIGTDVLMGLAALHARGLIHRDIKPANILLNSRGKALIGDFGHVTNDIAFGYASAAGYWDHLAYEVWNGGGTSERSDIWALGATFYRLLHGQEWYQSCPDPSKLIKQGGFASRLKWLPHVPKRWRTVIRKMLEDDTKKRYQNADQALDALSKLPVVPVWKTLVDNDKVRWERRSETRLNVVEWTRTPRNNSWVAWSEPLAKGIKKTLGGSKGTVSASQAISELQRYLS